jgi:hypothetical protein
LGCLSAAGDYTFLEPHEVEDGQEEEDGQAPGLSECPQEGAASEPLGCQKLDPSIKFKKKVILTLN